MDRFANGFVSIAIDDGLADDAHLALRLLEDLRATFYVITRTLKRGRKGNSLDPGELQEMYLVGHEIGSHGRHHLDLTQKGVDLNAEIAGSWNDIAEGTGINPVTLAYPFGKSNDEIKGRMFDSSYWGARSVDEGNGYNQPDTDRYRLNSFLVLKHHSLEVIKYWLGQGLDSGLWSILTFHYFHPQGPLAIKYPNLVMEANVFAKLVDFLNRNRIEVVTIAEGVRRLIRLQKKVAESALVTSK